MKKAVPSVQLNETRASRFASLTVFLVLVSDAGVNVYMYEFQHRPNVFKDSRPSFVKADHGDDVGFVFGACFWNSQVKVIGTHEIEKKTIKCNLKTVTGCNFYAIYY